jgi:small GTP-binding protein
MRVKVVVVGEADVGKTCIVTRSSKNSFSEDIKPTIGAANSLLEVNVNGQTAVLNIWDTAGQEKYRSLTQMYFNGAGLAIAVFDITNKASFDVLPEFINLLKERAGPKIKFAVVGNKTDLPDRQVSSDVAEEFTASVGGSFYIETSALTGFRINELFQRIASLALESESEIKKLSNPFVEQIEKTNQEEQSGCC